MHKNMMPDASNVHLAAWTISGTRRRVLWSWWLTSLPFLSTPISFSRLPVVRVSSAAITSAVRRIFIALCFRGRTGNARKTTIAAGNCCWHFACFLDSFDRVHSFLGETNLQQIFCRRARTLTTETKGDSDLMVPRLASW